MSNADHTDEQGSLAQAQATIARQAEEIVRLKQRLAEERYAMDLHEALTMASAAGTIASPVTHSRLLQMIVETAAHVISARAGSLFLIDHRTEVLMFEVAIGQKAEEVKQFTVPMGHGIAGLVALTGQPMAISDAQHDSRQASDIAGRIGYTPSTILCVPLYYNDQIIGVLELLDKHGAPSFTTADMELLGLFANQAAVAIELSRTHQNLTAFLSDVLDSIGGISARQREQLEQGMEGFVASMEEGLGYRQAVELARLVQEISWQGEQEFSFCRTLLRNFAEYARARRTLSGELGAVR